MKTDDYLVSAGSPPVGILINGTGALEISNMDKIHCLSVNLAIITL